MGTQHPPTPKLVLVVEDDPILMMGLVDFVEKAGLEAVEAHSVGEAIDILEVRTDIRTVFADLDMRGSAAGMQFALRLRDRWPPIELLLISALPWKDQPLPERGVLVGKPFDQRKIVATLKRLAY